MQSGLYLQRYDSLRVTSSLQTAALKEAGETLYWLELLHETGFILDGDSYQSLYTDCEELIRILVSSIKTAKGK